MSRSRFDRSPAPPVVASPPPQRPSRRLLAEASLVEVLQDLLDHGREALVYLQQRPELLEDYDEDDVEQFRDDVGSAVRGVRRLARDGAEAAEAWARTLDAPPPAPPVLPTPKAARKPTERAGQKAKDEAEREEAEREAMGLGQRRRPGRPRKNPEAAGAAATAPKNRKPPKSGAEPVTASLAFPPPVAAPAIEAPRRLVCVECGQDDPGSLEVLHESWCSKPSERVALSDWQLVSRGSHGSPFYPATSNTLRDLGTALTPSAGLKAYAARVLELARPLVLPPDNLASERCDSVVLLGDLLPVLTDDDDLNPPSLSHRRSLVAAHHAGLLHLRGLDPSALVHDYTRRAASDGELHLNGSAFHALVLDSD